MTRSDRSKRRRPRLAALVRCGLAALTLCVAPAVGVLIAPTTAHAQDVDLDVVEPTDEGYLYYKKAAGRILKSAGVKVWDAAEKAKRSGFHQFAVEQATRAIGFDPNQKDAREYLCYVKDGKKWERDAEAWSKLRKQNTRTSKDGKQEPMESFLKRQDKWKEEELAAANKFVAAKYVKLGNDLNKKGFPRLAARTWEAAVWLDPENKAARKALGYKKQGKVWMDKKMIQAQKEAGKAKELKEESRADGIFGVTLNKAQTAHFQIESTLPVAELLDIAQTCEVAYSYYLSDLNRDPTGDVFGGNRSTIVFMDDGEMWEKWCDAMGTTEFGRKMTGTGNREGYLYGYRMREGSEPTVRKDSAIHNTIHTLNSKVFGIRSNRAWIDEGLVYFYTVKVQETLLTHCVAQKEGNYARPGKEGGLKDWKEPGNWKGNMRELVDRKADLELRALINLNVAKLEFDATVKAWAVITWMMDEHRDKFISLINSLKGIDDHRGPIEELWEMGLEEIDANWRRYAIRNY